MGMVGPEMFDVDSSATPVVTRERVALRTWAILGLLLLATMLMYMDRQALAQQKSEILGALHLNNEDYGRLEQGFGLAFAIGGIVTGFIADRISPRWLYPAVLLGWSTVGFATGWVTTYNELFACRVLLGFFEAGHWPCALVTAQRLLARSDRPLGNSILQSGASLGAIATPIVVLFLMTGAPDSWRLPFRVIGALGVFWVVAWLAAIRPRDLDLDPSALPALAPEDELARSSAVDASGAVATGRWTFARRFLALVVVVITINLCWQYFRAWMPGMLREQYAYTQSQVQYFSMAYYVATDVGCLTIGFLIKWLTTRGISVHGARMATFLACSILTSLCMVAAFMPASWLLLGILLLIGFGSLGQFPIYYSFSQELSAQRMGKITGVLSFLTWTATALAQKPIGRWIDQTGSYSQVTFLAGIVPLIGFLSLLLLWNAPPRRAPKRRNNPL
jgi:ACS family hexuronate transporter-like MFS transporter